MRVFLLFLLFFLPLQAKDSSKKEQPKIQVIQIVDRNGFHETISTPDRLERFERVNFFSPMPYQKVVRVFKRDKGGNVLSLLTAYHPNGQISHYLPIMNGRASGEYREWHSNGQLAIGATVIGGDPDITMNEQKSWIFDDKSYAYNEEGQLLAEIPYSKGELEGVATYYHPGGAIWKLVPYHKNTLHGTYQIFLKSGELLQTAEYVEGTLHGPSKRYWNKNTLAADEQFVKGLLQQGKYFDKKRTLVASIADGEGYRPLFSKNGIAELHQYAKGVPEGEVKEFEEDGSLHRLYHTHSGLKQGEDIEYYPGSNGKKPQLSTFWQNGELQGSAKTWYPDGTLESQREIQGGKKQGHLSGYYRNGSLMLIEEYEQDNLVRGEYYKLGEKAPVSRVSKGGGKATLYDAQGNFLSSVTYKNGRPEKK